MRRSSSYIVTLGFLLMGAMIIALSATALLNMSRAQGHIKSIVGVNAVKVALVSQMRNAARDRALILHRITLMNDPFEIDTEMQKYSESAATFRQALDRFRDMPLEAAEQRVLDDALARVRIGQNSQNRVMDLFQAQRKGEASRLLLEETIPAQENVFFHLNALLDLQSRATEAAFAKTARSYQLAYSVTGGLITGILIVGTLTALFVIRRTAKIESALFQEKKFAEVTLQSITDGVITTDTQGQISFTNPSAAGMTGTDQQGLLGLPVLQTLGLDRDVPHLSFTQLLDASRTQPFRRSLTLGSRDGTHTLELSLSPMRDESEQITGAVMVLHDVTDALRAAEQLRQLNATLEEKVSDRTRALSSANAELQHTLVALQDTQRQLVQAEKMASLGNLVAGISHEINTPLGTGVTSASSLQIEVAHLAARFAAGDMKRSELQDFLDHANQACAILLTNIERASNLIRSFKQVAVDQSIDDWRDLHLQSYLQEILTSLQPRFKHTAVTVHNLADPALVCHTHPGAVYQIVSNLVLNALIHAYEPNQPGQIRLRARREGSEIVLTCEDDGTGIAETHLDRIFEPFFTTRRGLGGTGLGLNIVYNLVATQLHGDIRATSAPHQGTTFTVRFPDGLQQEG